MPAMTIIENIVIPTIIPEPPGRAIHSFMRSLREEFVSKALLLLIASPFDQADMRLNPL